MIREMEATSIFEGSKRLEETKVAASRRGAMLTDSSWLTAAMGVPKCGQFARDTPCWTVDLAVKAHANWFEKDGGDTIPASNDGGLPMRCHRCVGWWRASGCLTGGGFS